MANFRYENFVMRFSYAVACILFFGVLYYAYWTEEQVQVPKDNQAPFSETMLLKDGQEGKSLEDRFLSLEKPHRTNKELQNWLNTVVSESLSFDAVSFSNRFNQIQTYYTSLGLKQYQGYLKTSEILSTLKNNDYRMSVFIDEKPLLLNSVSSQGVYRWLYQLPITISFLPRNTNQLLGQKEAINRKLTVRVQMRRVKLPDDPNAIQIESWTVTGRR